ncbi:unnamed protein product [Moneuplotes crassus]|uniref:Uncharacterized protein n=1 Tax=Euplotes crassus TaxID=5936 RepID=A0AAD1UN64_EUPCR|nr:unnamed protein product [Moneuplotes crassus]
MESITEVIKEKNTEIISLEKSILTETKNQDISRCQSILLKSYPRRIELKPLDSDS